MSVTWSPAVLLAAALVAVVGLGLAVRGATRLRRDEDGTPLYLLLAGVVLLGAGTVYAVAVALSKGAVLPNR